MKPDVALRNALLEIVSCMLSPNAEVRRIAEERKKALEVTEEYALHLLEILLSAEEALEERQMATILLRQYVQNHWNDVYEGFVSPKASDFVKQKIRNVLPMGLFDSTKKIRTHIAYILANIGADDYPHDWPSMCEAIFLNFEYKTDAIGAIDFINDFSQLATSNQIHRAAEQIYTVLFIICKDNKKYSTKIRSEAVFALRNFVSIHCIDNKDNPKLLDAIRNFCEMLANQLTLPHPEESDFVLKSQILKTYSSWLNQIPEAIGKTIVSILPTIWQILSRCGQLYEERLVNDMLPYRDPTESLEETPLLYTLTYGIFELLVSLLCNREAVLQITAALPDLLYYTVLFMSIPKETEILWKSNGETYIAEDFSETCTLVRTQAKELLIIMTRVINCASFQMSFLKAIEKHMFNSKIKSESYYWRIMEAVIYSVGSISGFIITLHNRKELTEFSITEYLNKWAQELTLCSSVFLLARIMWVGSKFAVLLSATTIPIYVMVTVHNLRESSFILRYSAIRALAFHLNSYTKSANYLIYMSVRDSIAHALIDAMEHSQGYILRIGLSALENLLKPTPPLVDTICNKLIRLMQNLFIQNINNPEMAGDLHSVIKQICLINSSYKNLEGRFLPIITNIINNVTTEGSSAFEAQRCAIELLSIIVKNCPETISDELIRYGFFGVFNCMVTINDCVITQCGADCLRSYLHKAPSQIVNSVDHEGRSGVDYILSILRYVLDPQKMEFACTQVGLLSITAMHTLGPHLEEHISSLLRGILSTMQRANSVLVEDSLLIIFAYLFYNHLELVVNYLTLIPGPQGESALTFIMNKWLSKYYYNFEGKYQHNLNILALTKVMEHTILTEDERVAEIKIFDNALQTSKHCTSHLTEIPLLLKILKFLLHILLREMEILEGIDADGNQLDTSIQSETEDSFQISLESDNDSEWFNDCDTISNAPDPLYTEDPIYNIELCDYLTNFLKNVSKSAYFCKCVQFFTNTERKVLIKIGVNLNV